MQAQAKKIEKRVCIVPKCPNNSVNEPRKVFLKVPTNKGTRMRWLKRARADMKYLVYEDIHFCEDHFVIPKDLSMLKKYSDMTYKEFVELVTTNKLPRKFQCQRQKTAATPPAARQNTSGEPQANADKNEDKTNDGKKDDDKNEAIHLDKFKRRLVRAIARCRFVEKKSEEELWATLQLETGCDCQLLWKRLRLVTLKKLRRLLAARDRLDNITQVARLTVTDWLVFDLLLVHEDVDVIGLETTYEETEVFEDLHNLVKKYMIESDLEGDDLAKAWMYLTIEYNGSERQCSPMLLQKRWYQLKESARQSFYTFWYSYRGNDRFLEVAMHQKPTQLQTTIAKEYTSIITRSFPTWEELVQKKKVILLEDFERIKPNAKKGHTEILPDLEVIEPAVETIDLDEVSDSVNINAHKQSTDSIKCTSGTNTLNNLAEHSTLTSKDLTENLEATNNEIVHVTTDLAKHNESSNDVCIVKTEIEDDEIDDVQILESEEKLSEPDENVKEIVDNDVRNGTTDTHVIDDNLKVNTNSNVPIIINDIPETDNHNDRDVVTDMNDTLIENINYCVPTITNDNQIDDVIRLNDKIVTDGDTMILEQTNDITLPKITCVFGGVQLPEKRDGCGVDTNDMVVSNVTSDDVSKVNADNVPHDIVEATNNDLSLNDKNNDVEEIDEINSDDMEMNDLILIDDGIEFEDDGIILNEHDTHATDIKKEVSTHDEMRIKEELQTSEYEEGSSKFDIKLLLNPVVYTQRLEHMDVFKFIEFDSVRDIRIIENADKESRPVDKVAYKQEMIKSERIKEEYLSEEDCTEPELFDNISSDISLKTLKCSNWMLQKPKNRSYNPIQLCKNPDFNTRLKRLTAGFLSIERNRHMLKECNPITIDLNKSFESKLTNGTLIVKNAKFTNNVTAKTYDEQVLLKNNNINVEVSLSTSKPEFYIKQESTTIERNRIINLPNIDEIRRLNKNILTAEVTPIQSNRNSKPPVEIVRPIMSNDNNIQTTESFVPQKQLETHNNNIQTVESLVPQNQLETHSNSDNSTKDNTCNNLIGSNNITNLSSTNIEKTDTNSLVTENPRQTKMLSSQQIQRRLVELQPQLRKIPQITRKTPSISWHSMQVSKKQLFPDDRLLASDTFDKILKLLNGETGKLTKQMKKKLAKNRARKTLKEDAVDDEVAKTSECQNVFSANKETLLNNKEPISKKSHIKKLESYVSEFPDKLKSPTTKINSTDISSGGSTNIGTANKKFRSAKRVRAKKLPRKQRDRNKHRYVTKTGIVYCCWARANYVGVACEEDHVSCLENSLKINCKCCCKNLVDKAHATESSTNSTKTLDINTQPPVGVNDQCDVSIILSDEDIEENQKISEKVMNSSNHNINSLSVNIINTDLNLNENHPDVTLTAISNVKVAPQLQPPTLPVCLDTSENNSNIKNSNAQNISVDNATYTDTLKCKTKIVHATPTYPSPNVTKKAVADTNTNINVIGTEMVIFNEDHICSRLTQKPVYLGPNKVLLCSLPTSNVENSSKQILPQGLRLILLPNGELAVSVDSDVQIDVDTLSQIPTILAAVQEQINLFGLHNVVDVKKLHSIEHGNFKLISNDSSSSTGKEKDIPRQEGSNTGEEQLNTGHNCPEPVSEHSKEETAQTNVLSNTESESHFSKTDVTTNNYNKENSTPSPNIPTSNSGINLEASSAVSGIGTNKKSILSDLMEMSGISSEDTIQTSDEILQSNTMEVEVSSSPQISVTNIATSQQLPKITLKDFNYSQQVLMALAKRPDLKMVSSFTELKAANENKRKFYKLDTKTGTIEMINVSVQKVYSSPDQAPSGSVIDLTDDLEERNMIKVKHIRNSQSRKLTYSFEMLTSGKEKVIKPVKLLKSRIPTFLKAKVGTGPTILPLSVLKNRYRIIKRKKTQIIDNIVLDSDDESNNVYTTTTKNTQDLINTSCHDSDSDDEPLAKKALRKRETGYTTANTCIPDNMNAIETPTTQNNLIEFEIPILQNNFEEVQSHIPEDSNYENVEEDCRKDAQSPSLVLEVGPILTGEEQVDDDDMEGDIEHTIYPFIANTEMPQEEEDCILGI